jgi:LacI family transcriptional regulator, galactose operon repressor
MIRRATIGDVAQAAKVGKITVSRVLNGSSQVTEKTRRRVLKAVKKLGYIPNENARALRLQRSRVIGLIVPALLDHFFATCAHVIHETAQKRGYMVMTVSSNGDPETENAQIEAMLRRHIEGILLVPACSQRCDITGPQLWKIPVVAFDRPVPDGSQDSVIVENRQGAKLATEHLVSHGHRNIAFLGPSGKLFTICERLQGFREAAQENGIQTEEISLIDDLPQAIAALKSLLSGDNRPTALLTLNNVTTKLVVEALLELKVDVPGTFALIGFDDFEIAHVLQPPLTVVRQPVEEMARCAAELLFERLQPEGDAGAPKNIILPVELVIRQSCGCQRGTALAKSASATR